MKIIAAGAILDRCAVSWPAPLDILIAERPFAFADSSNIVIKLPFIGATSAAAIAASAAAIAASAAAIETGLIKSCHHLSSDGQWDEVGLIGFVDAGSPGWDGEAEVAANLCPCFSQRDGMCIAN